VEESSRGAGHHEEIVPLGQVPKSKPARARDMKRLNDIIRDTYELAKQRGLLLAARTRTLEEPPSFLPDDVRVVLATFFLGPDQQCTHIDSETLRTLLTPAQFSRRRTRQVSSLDAITPTMDERAGGRWGFDPSPNPTCPEIRSNQKRRQIQLRVYDLLTVFPDRWLDSVVIDTYIHVLQEHCPFRDEVYVNSAEHDPTLEEIRRTPNCFKYIVCPLFYRSHWTVMFISHKSRRIRYLNSQVVDRSTPELQTRPFSETFPGYSVKMLTPSKQCDQSSCGVLVAMWTYLFLFQDESDMDNIQCRDIDPFRTLILQQLILSYMILNKNKAL